MIKGRVVVMWCVLLLSPSLFAREVWVVRFSALGRTIGCHQAGWLGDVQFFRQDGTGTVRLVGISGQVPQGTPDTINLPFLQVFSLALRGPAWAPIDFDATYALWALHLDVPDGTVIEGRDVVSDNDICNPGNVLHGPTVKASMPVISALTPAQQPQVKLGTDIGATPARQNVMVYNGGDQTAHAMIEVRRGCDTSLADSRTVTVPPNTIIQVGGLSTVVDGDCPVGQALPFVRYTVITVDQPSFSIVSTLSEERLASDIIPVLGLSVQ